MPVAIQPSGRGIQFPGASSGASDAAGILAALAQALRGGGGDTGGRVPSSQGMVEAGAGLGQGLASAGQSIGAGMQQKQAMDQRRWEIERTHQQNLQAGQQASALAGKREEASDIRRAQADLERDRQSFQQQDTRDRQATARAYVEKITAENVAEKKSAGDALMGLYAQAMGVTSTTTTEGTRGPLAGGEAPTRTSATTGFAFLQNLTPEEQQNFRDTLLQGITRVNALDPFITPANADIYIYGDESPELMQSIPPGVLIPGYQGSGAIVFSTLAAVNVVAAKGEKRNRGKEELTRVITNDMVQKLAETNAAVQTFNNSVATVLDDILPGVVAELMVRSSRGETVKPGTINDLLLEKLRLAGTDNAAYVGFASLLEGIQQGEVDSTLATTLGAMIGPYLTQTLNSLIGTLPGQVGVEGLDTKAAAKLSSRMARAIEVAAQTPAEAGGAPEGGVADALDMDRYGKPIQPILPPSPSLETLLESPQVNQALSTFTQYTASLGWAGMAAMPKTAATAILTGKKPTLSRDPTTGKSIYTVVDDPQGRFGSGGAYGRLFDQIDENPGDIKKAVNAWTMEVSGAEPVADLFSPQSVERILPVEPIVPEE